MIENTECMGTSPLERKGVVSSACSMLQESMQIARSSNVAMMAIAGQTAIDSVILMVAKLFVLKAMQEEIIKSVLSGSDVFA